MDLISYRVIVANGRGALPARAGADRFLVDLSTTPGRDHNFGIAPGDGRWIENTFLGRTPVAQFREHRLAPRYLDQFLNPSNPADQRIVPFLEEDARPPQKPRRGFRDPSKARLQFLHQRHTPLRCTPVIRASVTIMSSISPILR